MAKSGLRCFFGKEKAVSGKIDPSQFRHGGHLREEDLEEQFIRSSGPGGQNVNKVATCVLLVHRPTGVQVKCQESRSQHMNRVLARERLWLELQQREKAFKASKTAEREKAKRRNRPRPAGLKQRILEAKKKHSQKKKSRQRSFSGELF